MRSWHRRFITALLFCAVFSTQAKTTIAVSEIPALLNKGIEKGPYNHLLDAIEDIEVVFAPPARVEILFDQKQVDCLFPASTKTMPSGENLLQSTAVQMVSAFIFTLRPYRTLSELNQTTIGLRRGFTFGRFRQEFDAEFIDLHTDLNAFEMLKKGRVRGVVAYLPDAKAALGHLKMKNVFYDKSQPIYQAPDAFVCHPVHARFVERLNAKIEKWGTSGQLARWLTNQAN